MPWWGWLLISLGGLGWVFVLGFLFWLSRIDLWR